MVQKSTTISRYASQGVAKILDEFNTSLTTGLTANRVEQLRQKYGPNEIISHRVSGWQIFFRQFKSTFIYLLVIAASLALLLGETLDAVMIILFVLINTFLGFFQEYRSEKTVQLLKAFVIHKARVRRHGQEIVINSKELVPGDIVIVETGDTLPADLRFLKTNNLTVNESVLTGEAEPVKKDTRTLSAKTTEIYQTSNLGFLGTHVVSGAGEGVVIATGDSTTMGNISRLTVETVRESSFEKGINSFSRFILYLVLGTLVVIFFVHLLFKQEPNWTDLIIFSIALAVGVIPEALPVVTTFSLSRGALQLAKNKVVVKRLSAIEDLGGIEILCSDKTGTLTENKLIVADINSSKPEQTLFYACLSSDVVYGDNQTPNNAFDLALLNKLPASEKAKLKLYKKINELPFDPERRRNSVLLEIDKKRLLIVRGALESVLKCCHLTNQQKKSLLLWEEKQGKKGHRAIALAYREDVKNKQYTNHDETELHFLGLIAFVDPIKKTAKSAIAKATKLGIKVKILTGDSRVVAGEVAYRVGIIDSPTAVITGEEFEKLPSDKQHQAAERYSVFARVSPEQKYRLIQILEEDNEIGFLGEGINDAPALKIANVGLVVQGAADIAQEAADIVILNKDLNVIVEGINDGRQVFTNTIKYIKVTLSSNFGNFYAVAIVSLFIDYLPMLPLQILLLNLLSDFPMIAIATDHVDNQELKSPRSYDVKDIMLMATIIGAVSTLFDFIFFGFFYHFGQSVLQTNWFIGSILTELALIFSIRTKFFFLKGKKPSVLLFNLTIIAATVAIFIPFTKIGQQLFKFTAPNLTQLLYILVIVVAYFITTESVKFIYYRIFDGKKSALKTT